MKAFITKENIGKYLDDLPNVSYDFSGKKTKKVNISYSEMSTYVLCVSVTTVAACMVFNICKSSKLF